MQKDFDPFIPNQIFSVIPGRKIERSLSAKRKENIDSFIPTKPMLVKSKTLDRPPSIDSWDGQSKYFNFPFWNKTLYTGPFKNVSVARCFIG